MHACMVIAPMGRWGGGGGGIKGLKLSALSNCTSVFPYHSSTRLLQECTS